MKRGAPDHWKMRALAMRLKIPVRYGITWANGCMERLWHYTAKYHPQGDIGKAPDWAIAEACGWPASDAASLIEALINVRWLVRSTAHRILVHDWEQHADDTVKKTLTRKGLEFFCPEKSSPDGRKESPALAFALAFPKPLKTLSASEDAGVLVLSPPEPVQTSSKKEPLGFAEFWDLRWNSKDRAAAVKAFRKAATSPACIQQIMTAVRAQRAEILSRDLDKRPYMSTWLNKERFADREEIPELIKARDSPAKSKQQETLERVSALYKPEEFEPEDEVRH